MSLDKYSRQQAIEAAHVAAQYVTDNLETLPLILTEKFLLEKGGMVPPPVDQPLLAEELNQWGWVVCAFRQEWRERVHITTGRYPATVQGEGFRLLEPKENASFGEETAYNAALRGFKKGKFIIEHTRLNDLDGEGRAKLQNSKIRLAALESAVTSTERENRRKRKFKELRDEARASIPSVSTHLPESLE